MQPADAESSPVGCLGYFGDSSTTHTTRPSAWPE